ncbi:IS21 family transposase [Hippea sp. KM1]|uniref:IS21 family transposase n=1 Tax=Hippea sp. KM1 TaxID=944481 RepID=UPI00046D39B5|nr:IS21 family transposase [Hippea sp. KM1]
MISKEEFVVIHTLYSQGFSIRQISKILGLNRRTVSRRLKEEDLKLYPKRSYPSKLNDYKGYIEERINQAYPDRIPSTVILREINDMGYTGSLRTLQKYTKVIYDRIGSKRGKDSEEIIRFETEKGFQAQADWTTIRAGRKPIYAFVMVLGYSRTAFVYFTNNSDEDIFQSCHIKAFDYFGGIPKTILYDNLKSVIIQRDKYGKNRHGINNDFLDFSKGLFIPKPCKPYRAKTKGKVERFNSYLKNNFYKPLRAKLKNSGLEITPELLNSYIFSWLEMANNRIHGTTKRKPFDMLNILPPLVKSILPISLFLLSP